MDALQFNRTFFFKRLQQFHTQAVLPGGNEVAAKRLFLNTKQCLDQFFNEVDVISQVRHKNLVKLLGCSVDGPESFLIYEYHLNRSLDLSIFGNSELVSILSYIPPAWTWT